MRWKILAVVLTLLAVTFGVLGWARQGVDIEPAVTGAPRGPTVLSTDRVQRAPLRNVDPLTLVIPAIGVSTPLVSLGLNPDKTVEVPSDPTKAGWYRLGPAPGSPGSAVILGHVDSQDGPAVFYRLKNLKAGDQLSVARADGSVARFAVQSIRTYANDDFPAAQVYRNKGARTLTLVTCGGTYDKANGGYQANVVVSAAYVGRI